MRQIWLGATDQYLDQKDPIYETEVDIEILGGCIMAFVVITPMILLAYAVEGSEAIQSTALDSIFCFTAAATLIATGSKFDTESKFSFCHFFAQGMTCFAWNNANDNNTVNGRRDFEAAGALGVFTIATGVLYLLDFFWVMYKKAFLGDSQQTQY